jgi:hypothetical protein
VASAEDSPAFDNTDDPYAVTAAATTGTAAAANATTSITATTPSHPDTVLISSTPGTTGN